MAKIMDLFMSLPPPSGFRVFLFYRLEIRLNWSSCSRQPEQMFLFFRNEVKSVLGLEVWRFFPYFEFKIKRV